MHVLLSDRNISDQLGEIFLIKFSNEILLARLGEEDAIDQSDRATVSYYKPIVFNCF